MLDIVNRAMTIGMQPVIRRNTILSIVTAAFVLSLMQGCGPADHPATSPSEDYQLPEISVIAPQEMRAIIDEGRGSLVVVNLWATWCPPCVKELPAIANFYRDSLSRDDVLFLSFSADAIDTVESKVHLFMNSYEVPFPVQVVGELDRDQFIADMGIEWDGLFPTTYLFGADGALLRTWAGEVRYEVLATAVDAARDDTTPETASR